MLGANNLPLDIVGEAMVVLEIGDVKATHRVYVCTGLSHDLLVGIDFFRGHKCVLDFAKGTVSTGQGEAKMSFHSLNHVCRVQVADTVTLAPNMVIDIPCKVESPSLGSMVGVVEPEDRFESRYCAGVMRTAATLKEGRLNVRVFNPNDKPIKVFRCSTIGNLHPLAEEAEKVDQVSVKDDYSLVHPKPTDYSSTKLRSECNAVLKEDFHDTVAAVADLFPIDSDLDPPEEKRLHHERLANHSSCISRGPLDLGHAKGVQHSIDTGSAKPIHAPLVVYLCTRGTRCDVTLTRC